MKHRFRTFALAAVLASLVSMFTAVVTGQPAAAAVSCYGGQVEMPIRSYNEADGQTYPSTSGYYTTSSRCNDIQVRLVDWNGTSQVWFSVRLCWVTAGWCKPYVSVQENTGIWTVLATNVSDGTKFRIEVFNSNDWPITVGGYVAA